jgi:hypothetical protein
MTFDMRMTRRVKFVQIMAWREFLFAVDNDGYLWRGLPTLGHGEQEFEWHRVLMPVGEELPLLKDEAARPRTP